MTTVLYDKINSCNNNDFVIIKDNLSISESIRPIIEITDHRIKTKDYIFSKESLQCVDRHQGNFFIFDILFNINRQLEKYFKSKSFSSVKESNRYILTKKFKSSIVTVYLYQNSINYKNSSQVVIICNSIILFSGDIFSIKDIEIIYKCVIKKLE